MRPEANVVRGTGGADALRLSTRVQTPGDPPSERGSDSAAPLRTGAATTARHYQPQELTVRETGAGPPLDKHNPHIAGTYFTALRYACPELGWHRFADSWLSCEKLLKAGEDLPEPNPLSLVALTNFHKWVTKGARKTAGTRDRVTFDRQLEERLLCEEVDILKPHVVVFQSAEYAKPRFRRLRSMIEWHGRECLVVYHPSNRMHRGRLPGRVVHPVEWIGYPPRVRPRH